MSPGSCPLSRPDNDYHIFDLLARFGDDARFLNVLAVIEHFDNVLTLFLWREVDLGMAWHQTLNHKGVLGREEHLVTVVVTFSVGKKPSGTSSDILGHYLDFVPYRYQDILPTLELLFGTDFGDPKIRRIDLKSDVDITVDAIRKSCYFPYKRISSQYLFRGNKTQLDFNRGIVGFTIGVTPLRLKCYDLRYRRREGFCPETPTRLEMQFQRKYCPVKRLSELPKILELSPFDRLKFLAAIKSYDFENDRQNSLKRFMVNKLIEEYSFQQARRILNASRNFNATYRGLLFERTDIENQLQENYLKGTREFFGLTGESRQSDSNSISRPRG